MKVIPDHLLILAMQEGGLIDLSDGRLTIVTEVLPPDLAEQIEEALEQAVEHGVPMQTH